MSIQFANILSRIDLCCSGRNCFTRCKYERASNPCSFYSTWRFNGFDLCYASSWWDKKRGMLPQNLFVSFLSPRAPQMLLYGYLCIWAQCKRRKPHEEKEHRCSPALIWGIGMHWDILWSVCTSAAVASAVATCCHRSHGRCWHSPPPTNGGTVYLVVWFPTLPLAAIIVIGIPPCGRVVSLVMAFSTLHCYVDVVVAGVGFPSSWPGLHSGVMCPDGWYFGTFWGYVSGWSSSLMVGGSH